MSIPNLIPHKTLYISGYIYSYYAFVFIFEFPEHISKHILQFHASLLITRLPGNYRHTYPSKKHEINLSFFFCSFRGETFSRKYSYPKRFWNQTTVMRHDGVADARYKRIDIVSLKSLSYEYLKKEMGFMLHEKTSGCFKTRGL